MTTPPSSSTSWMLLMSAPPGSIHCNGAVSTTPAACATRLSSTCSLCLCSSSYWPRSCSRALALAPPRPRSSSRRRPRSRRTTESRYCRRRRRSSASLSCGPSLCSSAPTSASGYTSSSQYAAAAIFIRFSYGALLAHAAGSLAGPVTGMTLAHLGTACAAGLLGHALAEYRMRDGSERAAEEAAARTMAAAAEVIERQSLAFYHTACVSGLTTLFMAARVVWLVFFPTYSYFPFIVFELSCLVCWILYFWAAVVALPNALVSVDLMMRLMCYHIGSYLPSIILFFVLFPWLWIYYFGLQMMAMAAFFGYLLALNMRYKDILLARGVCGVYICTNLHG